MDKLLKSFRREVMDRLTDAQLWSIGRALQQCLNECGREATCQCDSMAREMLDEINLELNERSITRLRYDI